MKMENILEETELYMQEAILGMEKRFINVRAGRANASMVNGVLVSYYGSMVPLIQLATVSIPEARQIAIKPFDRSSLGAIEKGIHEANIGLTPNNNGEYIILNIPALTEETRRELVKQVKQIAEETKIQLRNIRQEANNDIKKSDATEDDIDFGQEQVQELINKFNKVVEAKTQEKEKELLSV
jgi:ribosome recycling factor